ncbi:peroxidase [Colletotrichum higginsianum]|uniref:Peroxidase n=2 Tax=Colletotrichum higginsianum TaxID=80884 RepID=H1V2L2_COLHI|nr:Peroxidase [Colletotrichum higginsianum IMI 349063]OBR02629.1 Peroxidase [Colletotrichum higginsianum IMI 349063]TID06728.1 Versatile peroxidase VPL2 [Colletotrichum higginsianum]CCF34464.1 peroxidase [Colletotrichum higginsianum]
MRTASLIAALVAGIALARPGMDIKKLIADAQLQIRQIGGGGPSTELIGDLVELRERELTATGAAIRDILITEASGQDVDTFYDESELAPKGSEECDSDDCCIWKYIADDLAKQMVGTAGRCNSVARGAIRLGFHDAAAWSKSTGGTGADGSIILANECKTRSDNKGLEEICDMTATWFAKYKKFGISMADLIQLSANVATVSCPLGPRVRTFVGRKDSSTPATKNLLPDPSDSSAKLFKLFGEKSFTPAGLVALLGAHSTSQQRFVDPSRADSPQDSTPGTWDIAFYQQTLNPNAPPAVFKFQSDIHVSLDPETNEVWRMFAAGPRGQAVWNQAYASEYVRMSLLGVNNINDLTECTKVLPPFRPAFEQPDQDLLDKVMGSVLNSDLVKQALEKGDKIPPAALSNP